VSGGIVEPDVRGPSHLLYLNSNAEAVDLQVKVVQYRGEQWNWSLITWYLSKLISVIYPSVKENSIPLTL
jgi:hypothetical protein